MSSPCMLLHEPSACPLNVGSRRWSEAAAEGVRKLNAERSYATKELAKHLRHTRDRVRLRASSRLHVPPACTLHVCTAVGALVFSPNIAGCAV